jgi:hypothetical protein
MATKKAPKVGVNGRAEKGQRVSKSENRQSPSAIAKAPSSNGAATKDPESFHGQSAQSQNVTAEFERLKASNKKGSPLAVFIDLSYLRHRKP